MTRGVILQINVNFRRAWFVLYKLILLNKQNLLIMLFPFSLWSEFHFPPVDHGIPCFSMTWISFFSCRSCSFRFSHDSMVKFSLRVILSRAQGKEILHSAPFDKIHIILLSNPILSIQLTWCKTLKHLTTYHF